MDSVHTMRPATHVFPATAVSGRTLSIMGVAGLALAGRLISGWNAPLWFDETFSAVIATQPDTASLIDWCLAEIGGPVYYLLLWIWAHLFGAGATALRSLSLLCSLGAPIVASRFGHPSERIRLSWAAMLALWTPTFDYASNARCYALLLLVNTLQAIAFLRLLREPTRGRALAWTGLSVIGILTHYQTAVLAGVQGVIFLSMHRRAALRCWPALIALLPMVGWMAFHMPMLLHFSGNGAWYPPMGMLDLLVAPATFFESTPLGMVLGLGAIAATIVRLCGWNTDTAAEPDRALAASGLIAIAIVLLMSTIRPSFTWRYTAVFAPSILFGVAIWMHGIERRMALVPVAVLGMFAASAAGRIMNCLEHPTSSYRFAFNLDRPTAWLGETRPHHLGFLWDSPTATMSDQRRLAEVVGYFPKQAGQPATVSIMKAWPGTDPRRTIADRIRVGAIDAVIWISDASVSGTLSATDPGMIVRAGWTCRDFGRRPITVLACRPVPQLG